MLLPPVFAFYACRLGGYLGPCGAPSPYYRMRPGGREAAGGFLPISFFAAAKKCPEHFCTLGLCMHAPGQFVDENTRRHGGVEAFGEAVHGQAVAVALAGHFLGNAAALVADD